MQGTHVRDPGHNSTVGSSSWATLSCEISTMHMSLRPVSSDVRLLGFVETADL